MFNFTTISLFPELFDALNLGITGRAQKNGLMHLSHINPRQFTDDNYQRVDDRPYGGGPGMVMMVEPLRRAIAKARQQQPKAPVLYLSPQGQPLTQHLVRNLAQEENGLILLCGRYEGVDQRVIDHDVDLECSIGDYVLSGGELPAMVLIDAITRLQPGALGDEQSAEQDSFSHGLLDCDHYTRPEQIDGQTVPDVLQSGNHAAIARYRLENSLKKTWQRRPDLLKNCVLDDEQQALLKQLQATVKKEENDE